MIENTSQFSISMYNGCHTYEHEVLRAIKNKALLSKSIKGGG